MDNYEEYEFQLENPDTGFNVVDICDTTPTRIARHLANEIISQFEEMIDTGEDSRTFTLTLNRYWED